MQDADNRILVVEGDFETARRQSAHVGKSVHVVEDINVPALPPRNRENDAPVEGSPAATGLWHGRPPRASASIDIAE